MNRDELLTELAMRLAEWPKSLTGVPDNISGYWCFDRGLWPKESGIYVWATRNPGPDDDTINGHEWLAERERLINKPSWDASPEKAVALAQNENGKWVWYLQEPKIMPGLFWVAAPEASALR